jgi:hypothetical protein
VEPNNRLLDVKKKLAAVQTQTHITYSFTVSSSCRMLNVDFLYSPKILKDERLSMEIIRHSLQKYSEGSDQGSDVSMKKFLPLKNLITVSIDGPNGFRGACHRQDPEQHLFLAADSASPGLMPGPLAAGNWSITLSVHALVTETCTYRLVVWEGAGVR